MKRVFYRIKQNPLSPMPILLAVLMVVLLAGCAPATSAPQETPEPVQAEPTQVEATQEPTQVELVPVNLRLSWLTKGEYVHLFVARELGYFEEEGIEINILEGSEKATPMQLLVSGDDQFAYIAANDAAFAVDAGMDLIMVADFLQKHPQSIGSLAPTEMNDPQDMKGKTIVDTAGGTFAQIAEGFLKSQGMVLGEDVELIIADWGAKSSMFLQGDVDMASLYATNDIPVYEVTQGVDINFFKIADFGWNMLAHGLVASKEYVQANPDVVRGVVRAVQRGAEYTAANPEEAAKIMFNAAPDKLDSLELVQRQVNETLQLYHTENTEGKPCGWQDTQDWEQTISILYENGVIESRLDDVTGYFTNDFIDPDIFCDYSP